MAKSDESKMVTIRVWAQTNKVGSMCETSFQVAADEWNQMNEAEREEMAHEAAMSLMDWGYDCEEDDQEEEGE